MLWQKTQPHAHHTSNHINKSMNNNPDMTTTPPIPLSPRARHPHSPFDDIPLSSSSSSNDAIRIAFILPNSDVRPQFHLPSESSIEDVKRKLEMHIGWDSSASMQNSVTKGSTVTLISHGRMLGDKEQLKDIFVDVSVVARRCCEV